MDDTARTAGVSVNEVSVIGLEQDPALAEDVRAAAPVCLRHRLVLGYEALPAGVTADDAIAAVLERVAAPRPPVKGAV